MNANERNDITIRLAKKSDAKSLLDIYSHYVQNTAITFEIETPSVKEFKNRIKQTLTFFPYIVAEVNGKTAGYAYASHFKERAAYDWDVETSIYVHKDFRQCGIGKKLLLKLEELLSSQNILNVYALISAPEKEDEHLNSDSIKFHTRMGYTQTAEYKTCGFKFNKWYSIVTMQKFLGEHSSNPKPVIYWNNRKSF
ncbi:MAG: GNAT family N-acetyltransferase [Treponema sp.]